jgi:hypothetical protein
MKQKNINKIIDIIFYIGSIKININTIRKTELKDVLESIEQKLKLIILKKDNK